MLEDKPRRVPKVTQVNRLKMTKFTIPDGGPFSRDRTLRIIMKKNRRIRDKIRVRRILINNIISLKRIEN